MADHKKQTKSWLSVLKSFRSAILRFFLPIAKARRGRMNFACAAVDAENVLSAPPAELLFAR